MKCKIPEISWHNRDPVLSVDIQPKSTLNGYRLASGGTDAHVLIWYMKMTTGDIELDLAADLTRHQRAVNAVKWSPNGELLASGDDESVVFIWKQKSDTEPLNILDATNEQDKEVWITLKVLRGHMEDIYDLSWAPNSLFLVSGSVDNSAIVWDVQKGKSMAILSDHKGFVQGVAWDPKNQYIATLSTDRYLRIFDIQSKKVLHRIRKCTLPVAEDSNLHGKRVRLFHDDTLQTFFRRLSFTPDGKLLLTPSGITDFDGCTQPLNTTYAFSRYGFRQPAIVLPCPDQYTVAVRCCPVLYRLRPHNPEKNPPIVPLPYRMIFAVATKSSVYLYDTQQKQPFALISNIHYTRLTDITWSNDGRVVVVSSTDGFCSLITFEESELGEVYEDTDAVLEAALAQVIAKAGKTKKQKENDGRSRKPSMDELGNAKESTQPQREPLLEKINETEETPKALTKVANPIAVKRKPGLANNDDLAEKPQEESKTENKTAEATPIAIKRKPATVEYPESKADKPQATPIAIKRKSGPAASVEQNQATPIAIKRKPGPAEAKQVENDTVITTEVVSAEKRQATPIAIKRKPGPAEAKQERKSSDKESSVKPERDVSSEQSQATPIAIKRKPGPVEAKQESKSSEEESSVKPERDVSSEQSQATPIAIKRKPGPAETKQESKSSEEEYSVKPERDVSSEQSKATPIAIKRKPGPAETKQEKNEKKSSEDSVHAEEKTPTKLKAVIPSKVLAADIIIDKEILSSEEKFESPEKKSRPATPISVRRHPRTPGTNQTPTSFAKSINSEVEQTSTSALQKPVRTPRQGKNATPIAVRKTPRAATIKTPSEVNTPTLADEAMDAWPLNKDYEAATSSPTKQEPVTRSKKDFKELGVSPLASEETEDIRLIYEDTVEEDPTTTKDVKQISSEVKPLTPTKIENTPKQETPNNKTPRRVALKTISTPKSKKKLLD